MALVAANGADHTPIVAVLLFDGAELIDIAGPWEVFGTAGFLIHTVAEEKRLVTLVFGERAVPDYSFDDSPAANILLIPGGGYTEVLKNSKAINWVKSAAANADHVMSVCTGAFIAGQAGLLGGQTATTTYGMIDDLLDFPGTRVVHDRRFVDNGKIITTAGLTSGIDGALHLVSKLHGVGAAQSVALEMEYRWDPQKPFVRAALADRFLPDGLAFGKPKLRGASATLVSTKGTEDHWTIQLLVDQPSSHADFVALLRQRLASAPRDVESMSSSNRRTSKPVRFPPPAGHALRWTFADDQRNEWNGEADVAAAPGSRLLVTLRLARA